MWFVEQNKAYKITEAEDSGFVPSAEQLIDFSAFSSEASSESESRIMKVAGDTAEISIKGALTNSPNIIAMLFGGGNTTYQEIISALASAEQNKDVSNIILAVDSPGGHVNGLFSAVNAIANTTKPVKAIVSNMAASAAYALVAQADDIVAINEATQFGSIGILASVKVDGDKVNITSTKAPNKAPDVTTKEGIAAVKEELDAFHDIFVETIARGRSVVSDVVNKDFGKGGVLLAKEALRKGMIDSISNPVIQTNTGPTITDNFKNSAIVNNGDVMATAVPSPIKTNRKEGESTMTLQEFQSAHPMVFAEAHELGANKERDRVKAHLVMGEASGDMATAVEAINEGHEMTQALNATYMAASITKSNIDASLLDNPASDVAGGGTEANQGDAGDIVADLVEGKMGITTAGGVS